MRAPPLLVAVPLLVLGLAGCSEPPGASGPAPDSAQDFMERAQKALLAGMTDRAVELCRASLDENPGSARAHVLLGLTYRFAGRRKSEDPRLDFEKKEIEAFARAVELDPGSLGARVNLASSLLRRGDRRRAAGHLRRVAMRAPGKAWARGLADLAESAGEEDADDFRPQPEPGRADPTQER